MTVSTNVPAAAIPPDGRVVSKSEERRVIFASSLGTVFEWYDFYLYATLAPFFAALFFPQGNDTAALLVGVRDLRRRLPGAPLRRARLRAHRRPGRPQVHLPGHHRRHGRLDRSRSACCRPTTTIGIARADPARGPAAAPGPRARRRVRRRRDLRGRARPARQARLRHELDPDHRDARLLPVAARDRRLPRRASTPTAFKSWGWRIPFLVSLVLLPSRSTSGSSSNESPLFQRMKAAGKGSKAPLHGELPALPEQQDRAARAVRGDRRPGRRLVHGPVLRAVLPDRSRSRSTT